MSAAFDVTQDAVGIAAAVRSRSVSARGVLQSALEIIRLHDGQLNCFTRVLETEALAEADATDARIAAGEDPGPLAGVPVAVKNLLDIAGVAALILANIALIYTVNFGPSADADRLLDIHMSIGLTVLGLVVLRLLWRLSHRPPPMPAYPRYERRAAHVVHTVFYVVMLALPLSGWMHDSAWKEAPAHPFYWFGLFEWPRIRWIRDLDPLRKEMLHGRFLTLHVWCGYILYALIAAHLAGVLKHNVFDRVPELQRMLPLGWRAAKSSKPGSTSQRRH